MENLIDIVDDSPIRIRSNLSILDLNLYFSRHPHTIHFQVVLLQFQISIPLDDSIAATTSKNNMSFSDIQKS